jgi:putative ABC transport system ATP-binding protein
MVGTPPRTNAGLPLDARGLRIVRVADGRAPRVLLDVEHLAIPSQAHAAVVGPAGSGKSRLLRVLAGSERPARGIVLWGAIDIAAMEPLAVARWQRETVGIVGARAPTLHRLSARQSLVLPARVATMRMPRMLRERASALLADVGVPSDARAAALGPADARCVEIARALLRSPAIVVADEPTHDLDESQAARVESTLRRLCAAIGATLVVTTRDPALASRFDLRYDVQRLSLQRVPAGQPPVSPAQRSRPGAVALGSAPEGLGAAPE